MEIDRRLLLSGSAAALVGPGCVTWRSGDGPSAAAGVIDAHCHLFNATDLPATKFVTNVVLARHTAQDGVKSVLDLRDPTLLDRLVDLLMSIAKTGAPSAADEARVLARRARAEPTAASEGAARAFAERQVAEQVGAGGPSKSPGDRRLATAILDAAGRDRSGATRGLKATDASAVARAAIDSDTDFGTFVRWVLNLRMYRHKLAEKLARDCAAGGGRRPYLLTPAMVDYSLWLGESVGDGSSLRQQVEVMGLVSARRGGPVVHGYAPFDPLREVLFRRGKAPDPFDGSWSALSLVRDAVEQYGFLGVKLYPPMGFRASGNAIDMDFPKAVRELAGFNTRPEKQRFVTDLDAALDDLYAYCAASGAAVMAHAGDSNGAGPRYGRRADPAFWIPVFDRHPRLHVMLAHFGAFAYASHAFPDPPVGQPPPFDQTWESTFGRYVAKHPDSPVFADISYRANIFHPETRARCAAGIRHYMANYDRDLRHIVFGSDWVMLGIEKGYDDYVATVVRFLQQDCGVDGEKLERVMYRNAARFLALGDDEPGRRRIIAFYARHGLPAERLPRFDS